MPYEIETHSRLIAKVLRDVLRSAQFENLADLTDVLKTRLAKMKIQASPSDISAAYAMLRSNIELAQRPSIISRQNRASEVLSDERPLNRAEASAIYEKLFARYRAEHQ